MRRKRKSGKTAKKAKANQMQMVGNEELEYVKAPHSFVFNRGVVGNSMKDLISDVRRIMEPYTASKLKIRKKNVMKDFLTIAGTLHVSHFVVFTKTNIATYMKLICVPKGPTLTFKINEYCLSRDVLSTQRHPDLDTKLFSNHAVMVSNLPTESMENRLVNVTFKNMFPSINPNTVSLNRMRRCVLINYDPTDKSIDLRHYTMKVVPTGLSKGVKKLMKSKLPNLSGRQDISDFFLDKGGLSDSEGEQDGPHNQVMVPQKVKDRGVKAHSMNAIRLKEIGPRLNLSLVKIEEGFEAGNVLYHAFIEKTPEELEAARALKKEKDKLKMARRQKQEADIRKKKQAKEEHIKKSREGMEKKRKAANSEKAEDVSDDDEDDDIEYYRKEVGQEPEPEMFSQMKKKRKAPKDSTGPKTKKFKVNLKSTNGEPSPKDNKNSKFSAKFEKSPHKGNKGKVFKWKSQGGRPDTSPKENKNNKFSAKFEKSPQRGMKGKVYNGKSQGKPFNQGNKGKKRSFNSKSKR